MFFGRISAYPGKRTYLCSSAAEAHLNSTGMGPVYDGLLHFFTGPEDIVPVVGLALLPDFAGPNMDDERHLSSPPAGLSRVCWVRC
jgi:hypothetical protein